MPSDLRGCRSRQVRWSASVKEVSGYEKLPILNPQGIKEKKLEGEAEKKALGEFEQKCLNNKCFRPLRNIAGFNAATHTLSELKNCHEYLESCIHK